MEGNNMKEKVYKCYNCTENVPPEDVYLVESSKGKDDYMCYKCWRHTVLWRIIDAITETALDWKIRSPKAPKKSKNKQIGRWQENCPL